MHIERFQEEVTSWVVECFGKNSSYSTAERTYRFVEEALELAQSVGCNKEDVIKLVNYVYSRPVGEPLQEVGGTLVTLMALCSAIDKSAQFAAILELARCRQNIEKIRAKNASKPLQSPLPGKSVS